MRSVRRRSLLSGSKVALVLVVAVSGCVSAGESARVVDVVDGDTLDVVFNQSQRTVRLIGVDTPETGAVNPEEFSLSNSSPNRNCLSRWARKASEKADKLKDREIRVVHNGEEGHYGRLLAYVFVKNRSRSFNYILVRKGYARVYESRFSKRASFLEAERQARTHGRGFWGC